MYEDIAEKIVDFMTENGYMELAENPELKMAETMQMADSIQEPGYMEMICDYVRQIAYDHRELVTSARRPYWQLDDIGEAAQDILNDVSDSFGCSLAADRLMSFRRGHAEDREQLDRLGATDTKFAQEILWRGDTERIERICDVLASASIRDGEPLGDLCDEMKRVGHGRSRKLGLERSEPDAERKEL